MPFGTGQDHVLSLVEESTYGTFVAPTHGFPNLNDGIEKQRPRIEAEERSRGRSILSSGAWIAGREVVQGPTEHQFYDRGMGMLLKAAFGGVVTAGSGPTYTHTFTPAQAMPFYTVQSVRGDVGLNDRAFTYVGMMVNRWRLQAKVDDFVRLGLDWVGRSEDLGQAAVTVPANEPTDGGELLSFAGASVTVAGGSKDFMSVDLQGNNNLKTNRRFLGQNSIKRPLVRRRTVTGTLVGEFEDLTEYNRFVNADEFAIVLTFAGIANPTHQLAVTMNARYDGSTPKGGTSDDVLELSLPFKAIASGATDATAITAVYTSPDATIP